ncbi:class I SAM-dependent methyltransferase [Serratia microhaemolytica]|uniref:class I SAM-dependent methyltransferase n=1 Tax=Serratia microhaemolytica TaxID=2675110 RepID=UPI000FDF4DB7|nr:rRNA adenine N-6-methyltransferase family protein [Serratia microhaemolytica]
MSNSVLNKVQPYLKSQADYFKQFIKSPRTFGSLAPSSPWLCNRMVQLADLSSATVIAELGAGSGVLTRRLLNRLAPDSELDAYEIQPDLAKQLQVLAKQDDRLQIISQSAERLQRNYDIIFSCLPLLSIPAMPRLRILRQIRERLNQGGTLIQFQYSPMSEKLLSRYFVWERVYEMRNFPPAWVYLCTPR